jgi:hypothetical protein
LLYEQHRHRHKNDNANEEIWNELALERLTELYGLHGRVFDYVLHTSQIALKLFVI